MERELVVQRCIRVCGLTQELHQQLVLKGGNALRLAGLSERGTVDIDYSLAADLTESLEAFVARLQPLLAVDLFKNGFELVALTARARPKERVTGVNRHGGYQLDVKVARIAAAESFRRQQDDADSRKPSRIRLPLSAVAEWTAEIQISPFEHIEGALIISVDGIDVLVYSPAMQVCEKLRALCQQLPQYAFRKSKEERARDFYDLHRLMIRPSNPVVVTEHLALLTSVFAAKQVPLMLLRELTGQREFHRPGWAAVQNAVPSRDLEPFDFYFEFVINRVKALEALGVMDSPPA
jgi:hypothetical protein